VRFQITHDRQITEQLHVYENRVVEVLKENMKICKILQAYVLIEKFPQFWSDYKNHLKYRKKDLSLEELINHMRIEETNSLKQKLSSLSLNSSIANLVQSAVHTHVDRFKGK